MAIGLVATWCLISVEPVRPILSTQIDERAGLRQVASVVQKPVTTEAGSVGLVDATTAEAVAIPLTAEAELAEVSPQPSEVSVDVASENSASELQLEQKPTSAAMLVRDSIEKVARAVKPCLPVLVSVWLLGVLICSIRPIWGLWIQWRLRHSGLLPVSESIQTTLTALIQKLRLTRAVRIAESALVKVPMVVGYLHPMILLPASVITGLTSSQLEAVLAHELAHVRRHDWLINTLQVIAETLLFYHPAVWWLSSRIRQERELCCDDIALGLNVDKAVFARTLLTLEELRQKALVPVMAATGGDLTARVRRLLITSHATPSPTGGTVIGMFVVVGALVLMVTSLLASQPRDEAKTSQNATARTQSNYDETPDAEASLSSDAEQKNPPAPNPKTARQRTIQVLDDYDRPVVGADVRLSFQQDGRVPSPNDWLITAETKEKGILTVDAPSEANKVYLTVVADGFYAFRDQRPAVGESTIRLERARVIRIRAFDQAGNLLRKIVPWLAGNHGLLEREFSLEADGSATLLGVAANRSLMRVVTSRQNGLFLFSDLIDLDTAQPGADGVIDVVLKPGARITGKLDDSVPRPVGEGYVQLRVCEGTNHRLGMPRYDITARSTYPNKILWIWEDSAAVQPDGTFVFESVPSGGLAQIHAIVDGFMSANPSIDELSEVLRARNGGDKKTSEVLRKYLSGFNIWPQLLPIDSDNVEVRVKCRPTASCNLRILDSSGRPVAGAAVCFKLNATTIFANSFPPGLSLLNNSNFMEDILYDVSPMPIVQGESSGTPRSPFRNRQRSWENRSYHEVISDENGRAIIRNLPGNCRLRFTVKAKGFLLPESPLYEPLEPNFPINKRVGYSELLEDEIVESTIYLEREQAETNPIEREQPVAPREVVVVDQNGEPLEGVSLAVAEIRVGGKDWHKWSTQRFGTALTANTDAAGRVTLQIPSVLDSIDVERIRLAVNLSTIDLWVNGELVDAPLKPDSGLIAIVPDPESKRRGRAKYGLLNDILQGPKNGPLLQSMIKRPSLAKLRQLLAGAKSKQPEPAELLDEGRFGREAKGARVHLIPSGDSLFALVGARVRPADGTRKDETDMTNLPECVFVFDSDGKPVAALGGEIGTTGAGDPENVEILCLGPEEDWFVRVTRFQENGPFAYQSVYYRIGESVVPSLKYYHYANSNARSNGPEKISRHGDLYLKFPQSRNRYANETVGITDDGVAINGIIVWDGDKNRFFGAPAQSVDSRPLYKVDTTWSQDFSALNPKADQMIISGGIRDGAEGDWYGWDTVIPQGFEAIVRVSIPKLTGEPQILEQTLGAGRHFIQFEANALDDEATAKLNLRYGENDQQIQNADLPFRILQQQNAPAIVNVLDAQKSVRLVERPLERSEKTLTLEVTLNPLTEAGK
ncbi:MAG: M56 family metallopeptidase [Planctomycetaceae bacterium]